MWRCSGRHWLNTTIAWTIFAFAMFVAVGANGEPVQMADGEDAIVHLELRTVDAIPRPAVVLNISSFDLTSLESAAFGDHHDETLAK